MDGMRATFTRQPPSPKTKNSAHINAFRSERSNNNFWTVRTPQFFFLPVFINIPRRLCMIYVLL